MICETLIHNPTTLDDQDDSFDQVKFSSFYVGPKSDSCPLILWPHGGPHAVTLKDFKNDLVFWLKLGFGILLPNYRGSLGNGQKGVFALTKHSGDFDVKDCYQALEECLQKYPNIGWSKSVHTFSFEKYGNLIFHHR